MRRISIRSILFVTAYLFFLCLFNYPFIGRLYNSRVSAEVARSYSETVKGTAEEELARRLEKAAEYNRALLSGPVYGDDESRTKAVSSILEMGESCGVLHIPAIDLTLSIYPDVSDESLDKGAGIMPYNSLPVGGASTHTCLSAHRGMPGKTLFTNLDLLQKDDLIELYVLGEKLLYKVTSRETVRPEMVGSLSIQENQDLLTLITCTPYGINSHRLLIHAVRTTEEEAGEVSESVSLQALLIQWWWTLADLLFILSLFIRLRRNRQHIEPR